MDDISELRAEAARTPLQGVWAKGGPVFAHLSEDTVNALEARTMASFGDAASLGMWAFATGVWITGLFEARVLPMQEMALLFPVALIYSGIVLLIAGLFLFRRNNNFQGSAFCSFAAFNMVRAVLLLLENRGVLPSGPAANVLQGCLIESFAYIALSLFVAATRMNLVLVLVLAATFFGFALSGLPLLTNQLGTGIWARVGQIGGYFLFAAGFFAYYGGTAILVNTAWRRVVLPIGGQA